MEKRKYLPRKSWLIAIACLLLLFLCTGCRKKGTLPDTDGTNTADTPAVTGDVSGQPSSEAETAEVKNGVVEIGGISYDFGDNNVQDGEIQVARQSPGEREKALDLQVLGDVYVWDMKEGADYREPMSVRMTLPDQYSPAEDETLFFVFSTELVRSDGEKRPYHTYIPVTLKDGEAVCQIVPNQLFDLSSIRFREDPEWTLGNWNTPQFSMSVTDIHHFLVPRTLYSSEKHFEMYLNPELGEALKRCREEHITDYTKLGKNGPKVQCVIQAMQCLEDAYDYYYTKLGYEADHADDVFPLPVQMDAIPAHGYFNPTRVKVFGHPYMQLNIDDIYVPKDMTCQGTITVYHEMFHAVQCAFVGQHSYCWNHNSPFWEASATYYESKIQGTTAADNFTENIAYAYRSLFPSGDGRDNGYALNGLIHYINDTLMPGALIREEDIWIKDVLYQGGTLAAMKSVTETYSSRFEDDWQKGYYLALSTGRLPLEPTFDSTMFYLRVYEANSHARNLKIPDQKNLTDWLSESATQIPDQRKPLILAEWPVSVKGKSAHLYGIRKPDEPTCHFLSSLPENVKITLKIDNAQLQVTPIVFNKTRSLCLSDVDQMRTYLPAQDEMFIMVYSAASLDSDTQGKMQIQLEYQGTDETYTLSPENPVLKFSVEQKEISVHNRVIRVRADGDYTVVVLPCDKQLSATKLLVTDENGSSDTFGRSDVRTWENSPTGLTIQEINALGTKPNGSYAVVLLDQPKPPTVEFRPHQAGTADDEIVVSVPSDTVDPYGLRHTEILFRGCVEDDRGDHVWSQGKTIFRIKRSGFAKRLGIDDSQIPEVKISVRYRINPPTDPKRLIAGVPSSPVKPSLQTLSFDMFMGTYQGNFSDYDGKKCPCTVTLTMTKISNDQMAIVDILLQNELRPLKYEGCFFVMNSADSIRLSGGLCSGKFFIRNGHIRLEWQSAENIKGQACIFEGSKVG